MLTSPASKEAKACMQGLLKSKILIKIVSYAQLKGAYCSILLLFPMLLVSLILAVVVRSIIRETNNIVLQGRVLKPEVLKAYCSLVLRSKTTSLIEDFKSPCMLLKSSILTAKRLIVPFGGPW